MQGTNFYCKIKRIDAFAYRIPIANPVITSFGAMTSRPAVFVRLEDSDGVFGWGEIFANWPAAGAEHRARLVVEDVSDLILNQEFLQPSDLFETLTRKTHIRALQCGEWGPFAHVIAGLDLAFHDLLARRAGWPLARFLDPDARLAVPTYASGIHIRDADRVIEDSRSLGFDAFKVKVGFDLVEDINATAKLTAHLPESERLFADVNQGWNADDAITFLKRLDGEPLGWLEEPIAADAPMNDWQRVSAASSIPLAGGENISSESDFDAVITTGVLDVIQPDVAKWGGVSKCREVAIKATSSGRLYCPHFLGGGIGLAASAAILASVPGGGLLEVDSNANPLREAFGLWKEGESRNCFRISELPGLGIVELPEEIAQHQTLSATATAPGKFSVTVHP